MFDLHRALNVSLGYFDTAFHIQPLNGLSEHQITIASSLHYAYVKILLQVPRLPVGLHCAYSQYSYPISKQTSG